MERRALKIATSVGGPALAVWASIACGGESKQSKQLPFLADTPPANSQPTAKTPEVNSTDASFNYGEKVGDFNIGNDGGETLNYKKDLAGRAVIIYYCCVNGPDTAKIEALKQTYDESKLVVVNVVIQNGSKDLVAPIVNEYPTVAGSSYDKFRGPGNPYLVAIDKNGNWVYKRQGANNVSAGIEDVARKLANGEEFAMPTEVISKVAPVNVPTPAPEAKNSDSKEAVIDMGNFDLAITGWEEFKLAPYETSTHISLKHVVVRAIMRNKSDQFQDLSELGPQAGGAYNVQFADFSGNNFISGQEVVVPIEYKGVFDEPYEQSVDGTMRNLRELSPRPNLKPSTLMPPGFGLPVFFVGEMPVDTNDYGVHMYYLPIGAPNVEKIVKKGQVAKDFSLIAPDVKIYNADDSLVGKFAEPSYEIKLVGSSKASFAPQEKPQNVLLLGVKNNSNSELHPLSYSIGRVYLKDGRVVSLGNSQKGVLPHQESVYGLVVGTENPNADFPNYSSQILEKSFNIDLEGAVLLLSTDGGWKAWKMPDIASNPIGAGVD